MSVIRSLESLLEMAAPELDLKKSEDLKKVTGLFIYIRKDAFLEAAQMVEDVEIGRKKFLLPSGIWEYRKDIAKLLREKAEE